MSNNSPRAIIIEDDTDINFIYRMKLENAGFSVEIAFNGLEGLDKIEKFKPDIILLDLMMPVMSGGEMLARLRSHEWASNMRVIILTNISKDEAPQALRFLHVDRYVVKAQHTPAQVLGIVYEVLGITAT